MTDTTIVSPRETSEHKQQREGMKARLKELARINRELRLRVRTCNDGSLASYRLWHARIDRRAETTQLLIDYHLLRGTGKEGAHVVSA